MKFGERLTAYMAIGAVMAVVMIVRGVTTDGTDTQADFEAASARIGWTEPSASDHIAQDIFERVNDERSARGMPPLVWHEGLADLARDWSHEMIQTGYRHSDDVFRRHPAFAGTGENIAMGYLGASDVHLAWMESDGHRLAILSPDFTAIGIGVVCRNDGAIWATEIFGVPHRAVRAPDPVGGDGLHPVARRDDGPTCPRNRRG